MMKSKMIHMSAMVMLVLFSSAEGFTDDQMMPMRFTPESNPEAVLMSYPLGSMNKLAVLSHHGKADRVVQLPNGREGWIYDLSIHFIPKMYITPKGEKMLVNAQEKTGQIQIYTLVFGKDERVIDVIYQNKSTGYSALQIQQKKMMDQ
ncbi:MAG: hypothetical protein OQL09_05795 [Gammaproteobacteria bacterium]|nr:hypothetical protein [Gammaproteobacteria bacterium]